MTQEKRTLNKKALVDLIAEQTGATKRATADNVDAVIDAIKEVLRNGDDLQLTGFAKFSTRVVPEQERYIALVGETRVIKEHSVLKAKLSDTILA